jgi:hypothetical protein
MNEPCKHYAKRKKPVTKDYILYDSCYIRCPKEANIQRQRLIIGRDCGNGGYGVTANEYEFLFGEDGMF